MENNEEITLEYAKERLDYWRNYIMCRECSHDLYYLSASAKEDEHNLFFWEQKVKELTQANK